MDKKFSSLLEEITTYVPVKDGDLFVESRAINVIASAVNLIKLIESKYDAETAGDLTRRLINSIKGQDEQKFCRKIRQIRESRKGASRGRQDD